MGLLTRLAVLLGRQPWLPELLPLLVRIDLALLRLTRGRVTLLSITGLPNLFLTVPGRRTGQLRTTPLLGIPYEGCFLIAGSNFGLSQTPGWVHNLRRVGRAEIRVGGRTQRVSVREVSGEERDHLYEVMTQTWPNYRRYAQRVRQTSGRTIGVFELRPLGSAHDG
jgi:deazaflavin-dependent oxidoreductase (nitroreductase family)